jgi:hypothetical protein
MAAMKFRFVSAASTNLNQVKGYGANLKGALLINTNAAARYVKLYESTDTPTVGTTAPAFTIEVPASSQVPLTWSDGINFGKTMWVATTTGVADTDSTAVGAGDLYVQLFVE